MKNLCSRMAAAKVGTRGEVLSFIPCPLSATLTRGGRFALPFAMLQRSQSGTGKWTWQVFLERCCGDVEDSRRNAACCILFQAGLPF